MYFALLSFSLTVIMVMITKALRNYRHVLFRSLSTVFSNILYLKKACSGRRNKRKNLIHMRFVNNATVFFF